LPDEFAEHPTAALAIAWGSSMPALIDARMMPASFDSVEVHPWRGAVRAICEQAI
jgi:hypothetical protein